MQIMTWLSKLETKTFSELMEAFFRDQPSTPNRRDKVIFWREVHQLFPSSLSLCVRIGSKYLTTAEISAFNTLAPVLYLKADPRIGEKPVVSVHVRGVKNLVTMARLTAVARASCLALNCLRHLQTGGEIHAL